MCVCVSWGRGGGGACPPEAHERGEAKHRVNACLEPAFGIWVGGIPCGGWEPRGSGRHTFPALARQTGWTPVVTASARQAGGAKCGTAVRQDSRRQCDPGADREPSPPAIAKQQAGHFRQQRHQSGGPGSRRAGRASTHPSARACASPLGAFGHTAQPLTAAKLGGGCRLRALLLQHKVAQRTVSRDFGHNGGCKRGRRRQHGVKPDADGARERSVQHLGSGIPSSGKQGGQGAAPADGGPSMLRSGARQAAACLR